MRRLRLREAQQRLNDIFGPVDWRIAHPRVVRKGDERNVTQRWVSAYLNRQKRSDVRGKRRRRVRQKVPYAVKQIRLRRNREMWQKHPTYRQLPFRFFLASRQAKW